MEVVNEQCPWCGSAISHNKFAEIQARIRSEEAKRVAEIETSMRKHLEMEKLAAQREAQEFVAKEIEKASADREAMQLKLKEAEIREAAILQQATEDAAKAAQSAEKKAQELAYKQIQAATSDRDALQLKLKDAETRETTIRQEAMADAAKAAQAAIEQAEQQRQKEAAELRVLLEADREQALLKKQSEFAREREAWQKKILEMNQQLQRKTANEIGDGAETDLYEILREAFPRDSIRRVKKGQAGPDITHEILHKGQACGRIVYDSKMRQDWKFGYVTKLREDQLEAGADHAILCTCVFPSGKKELCIESDVIVVNPARAIHIALLLRQSTIAMHTLGLSIRMRAEKTEKLYKLITSPAYSRRFEQVGGLTNEMLELEVQEKKAHDAMWKKRGALLVRQNTVLREIDTEISAVLEGVSDSAISAA